MIKVSVQLLFNDSSYTDTRDSYHDNWAAATGFIQSALEADGVRSVVLTPIESNTDLDQRSTPAEYMEPF